MCIRDRNISVSATDAISSLIDNASCCSLVSEINNKADIIINQDITIDSKIDALAQAGCCSLVGVIESKVSNLSPNITQSSIDVISSLIDNASCCSLTGQINTVIGSMGDPGITSVPGMSPFTTLDQINNTDLTIIGWLKSIMAQLVGV